MRDFARATWTLEVDLGPGGVYNDPQSLILVESGVDDGDNVFGNGSPRHSDASPAPGIPTL